MTNDNCHFSPHPFPRILCSKFIIIYNMYIIYNNGIIFTFSSSVPPQNMTLSFVIFVIFLPLRRVSRHLSTKKMTIMTNDNCHFPPHTLFCKTLF